jgi:hypothetical protein
MRLRFATLNGIQKTNLSSLDVLMAEYMNLLGQIPRKLTTAILITGMMLKSKLGRLNSWNLKWRKIKRKMKQKKRRKEG